MLHATVSVFSPSQALPPFDSNTFTCLERDFLPPPHVFEQDDQLPKGSHPQSTGHNPMLQSAVSVSSPSQGCPPFDAGISSSLERDFLPSPHVFEQDDQLPKGPHSQSTGHNSMLQSTVSVSSPSQGCHPLDAGISTSLERDFSPPPHVLEQVDHSP